MSLEKIGLSRSAKGGQEWWMYRSTTTGFIELYRTASVEIVNDTRLCKGLERVVTNATTEAEVDAYPQKRPKPPRYNPHHPNQLKIE